MAELPPLREVIARHGLSASKALGQNFLFDEQLLDRIAALPGDLSGRKVLEVGPGPGGLTRALLRAGADVTAIEMDSRCMPALAELEAAYPGKLRVIQGDALKLDHAEIMGGEPFAILSNLPYNVGTALFTRWLGGEEWPPLWTSLTLMFQQEVAQRIVAKPGSGAYGRLAVLAQWRGTAKLAMKVHRSAFTPPPKVMSSVVRVTPRAPDFEIHDGQLFDQLVTAAFSQRRKTLRNAVGRFLDAQAIEACNIDPMLRPERLAAADFARLANRARKEKRAGSTD